jgi:hypothetical protein
LAKEFSMDMPTPDELPGDLKQAGDVIDAAQDVINKVSDLLPDETRGIVVQISNLTGLTLGLKTSDFSSGGFTPEAMPAPFVDPFSKTVFGVKSTGLATGAIGSVIYEGPGLDVLLCGFSNPFLGGNTVNVTLTGARQATLSCRAVISSGNHCAANFVLRDTSGFALGDTVSLICLGTIPGARFLDGRTGNGTVGLAPNNDVPFTGARWQVVDGGGGSFVLRCLGNIEGPRFLDGRTGDGSAGLAPSTDPPFSGTHWGVFRIESAGAGSTAAPRPVHAVPAMHISTT